jgi:hypothetical protein
MLDHPAFAEGSRIESKRCTKRHQGRKLKAGEKIDVLLNHRFRSESARNQACPVSATCFSRKPNSLESAAVVPYFNKSPGAGLSINSTKNSTSERNTYIDENEISQAS